MVGIMYHFFLVYGKVYCRLLHVQHLMQWSKNVNWVGVIKVWNICKHGHIGTYIENIEEISMDILTKISMKWKLFKIHENIWKNSKQ